MFACEAGASRGTCDFKSLIVFYFFLSVYAVDASDAIRFAHLAVAENGYTDKIHLTQSKIEVSAE